MLGGAWRVFKRAVSLIRECDRCGVAVQREKNTVLAYSQAFEVLLYRKRRRSERSSGSFFIEMSVQRSDANMLAMIRASSGAWCGRGEPSLTASNVVEQGVTPGPAGRHVNQLFQGRCFSSIRPKTAVGSMCSTIHRYCAHLRVEALGRVCGALPPIRLGAAGDLNRHH